MHDMKMKNSARPQRSLRGIDLNLFVLFEAVYSEGGLTAAASRLGLTQPAVSHALARLRAALGDPLFIRRGSRVAPTPFARSIIEDVRRALKILQERLEDHRRFDPGTSNAIFRLALGESVEKSLLLPLMMRLDKEAPGISIVSSRVNRRDVERELASGTMDLAIDVAAPASIDIHRSLLTADRLVVAARRGHPALKKGLTRDTYLQLRHILVSSRIRGGALEDFELNRLGLHRNVALRCHSVLAGLEVVSSTDLLLTLGEKPLEAFLPLFQVTTFPLPFEAAPIDLQLYWHASMDSDPANGWLRSTITQILNRREPAIRKRRLRGGLA